MRTLRKRVLLAFATLALLAVARSAVALAKGPGGNSKAPDREFVQAVFIDFADDDHAGPGPHPDPEDDSDKFRLTQGGISWPTSLDDVEYKILDVPEGSDGITAVINAVATIDGFVTTRDFVRNDSSALNNPCSGTRNIVRGLPIDGTGGVLASASVCRNVATKQIVGFEITIDTDDEWSTTILGSADKFDVQNVMTHEFGDVAGLGHVNSWKDGLLTMYRFSGTGEIHKRDLGLGDTLGLQALY